MNEVSRQEKKFILPLYEFLKCSHYFKKIFLQDRHNGTRGYMVRSLYFDTPYDKDFIQKADGIEVRRKIRLRLYDPSENFAMLEMKQKQGSNQLKRSLRLNTEDAAVLAGGEYYPLLKYREPFAAECYSLMNCLCYQPKVIVQYTRKAFIAKENNIRITFDYDITATESNFDLFSTKLNMYPVFNKCNVVMEVKYNGFLLSYIQDTLNQFNKSEISVSKYCLGRSVGVKFIF